MNNDRIEKFAASLHNLLGSRSRHKEHYLASVVEDECLPIFCVGQFPGLQKSGWPCSSPEKSRRRLLSVYSECLCYFDQLGERSRSHFPHHPATMALYR